MSIGQDDFNIFDYLRKYLENGSHDIKRSGRAGGKMLNYYTSVLTPSFEFIVDNIIPNVIEQKANRIKRPYRLSIRYNSSNSGNRSLKVNIYCYTEYVFNFLYEYKPPCEMGSEYRSNSFVYRHIDSYNVLYTNIFESKAFADILIHQTEILRKHAK